MHNSDPLWVNRFQNCSRIAAAAAAGVGAVVLSGWAFDIPSFKSVYPGYFAMKPNLALAFILAGISLWLFCRDNHSSAQRRARQLCAMAVAVIGGLTCLEYILVWDAGIDQMLFRESPGAVGTFSPGRMALTAAICLLFVGFALLLLENSKGVWMAHILALLSGLITVQSLFNYLSGARDFSGLGAYTQMALHAGLIFTILSAGILCSHPRGGVMAVVSTDCAGGIMTRTLLPTVLLIPFVIGWLELLGRQIGLYSAEFGQTLSITFIMLMLVAVVWHNGVHLCLLDEKRAHAEESARRMKSDFISMIHHELNTPITAIQGTVALLKDSGDGRTGASQSRYIDILERNARRMSRLVTDTLDIMRLETDSFKLDIKKIDVWPPIRAACADLALQAGEKRLELSDGGPGSPATYVLADPTRLEQIISNLARNAVRFAKGIIRVSVESDGERVRVIVEDDGPGVDADDIPHLFEKFYRGKRQVGAKKDGSGLGLAIVKSMVEAHGGTVSLEIPPPQSMEQGTRFVVNLPAASTRPE